MRPVVDAPRGVLEPRDEPLRPGAVLIIDTGVTFEGYWSDFDRNYIVGGPAHLPAKTAACHDMLWRATERGFEEAGRKGATSTSVFRAMARECGIPDDAADDAKVLVRCLECQAEWNESTL